MLETGLSSSQIDQYREAGYLFIRSSFELDEIDLLRCTAKSDQELEDHAIGKSDDQGGVVRLSLWNHPGNDIYGMFARSRRIVAVAEQLLEEEPYHYHSKMIMKDARVGGAWMWHQDYGYWYSNGLLSPNLISCFIAIDRATKENGCLQIIPRSQTLGRIDHVVAGEQTTADPERVTEILKRFSPIHLEMQPGDVLFFHANLLHRSAQNRSNTPRWSMVCCYNAKSNSPYKHSHHPPYTPLLPVPDSAIRECGRRGFSKDADATAWLQNSPDQKNRTLGSKPA